MDGYKLEKTPPISISKNLSKLSQLVANWWFGARWFGLLGSPIERHSENSFKKTGQISIIHTSPIGNLSGHQLGKLPGKSEFIKGILGVYTPFQSPSIRGANIPNKQTERTPPENSPKTPSKMESIPSQMNITPWKVNMEPENDGLEDDFSFSIGCIFRFHVGVS